MEGSPPIRTALGILAAGIALAVPASARAAAGAYLDFDRWPTFAPGQSTTGATFIGPEGVPQVQYSWGVEDNPVTVSHWALQHWSWWLGRGDEADRETTVRAADWLLAKQRTDGAFTYAFDVDGGGVPMRAPWLSAMAQGEAISVLVRAYSVASDERYLDGARLALEPFTKTYDGGGVRAEWDGLTWFEEYPGESPKHVLNGFEVALIGLHDLSDLDPLAADLFAEGAAALDAKIATFDSPAARSQFYAALAPGHGIPPRPYPHFHAVLTRELANVTGSANLARWATVWEGYERPLPIAPRALTTPAVVAPTPIATPTPAPKPVCRLRGKQVRRSGTSCRRARRTLSRFVRVGRSPRGWTCRGLRLARCSTSGGARVSVWLRVHRRTPPRSTVR
jgi:hypothetical protein